MMLTQAKEDSIEHKKQLMQVERQLEVAKVAEQKVDTLKEQITSLSQAKQMAEGQHRDTVMDLNGKLNEKDALLQ